MRHVPKPDRFVLNFFKKTSVGGETIEKKRKTEANHTEGGFEDKTSTTAAAYRKWFQMCRDGLGADALLHERLGIVGKVDNHELWEGVG